MSQVGKRLPGPEPGFDRTVVLDQLVTLFWENGYSATSHEMMRQATGLSGSSLYNSFGDKRAIFDEVLGRYHDRSEALVGPLVEGSAGVEDLLTWVGVLRDQVGNSDGPAGCLMIATMGSPIGTEPDVVRRTQANLRRVALSIGETLERAADLGEVNRRHTEEWTSLLAAAYVGILTAAKGSPGAQTALDMVDGLEAGIKGLPRPN